MFLERLTIENLRIIEHAEIYPGEGLNLIVGGNGAGKTTVLEAVDILSRGRSFRTHAIKALLGPKQPYLRVNGRLRRQDQALHLGLERAASGLTGRINGKPAARIAEFAICLPVQALHPESHALVSGTPSLRRAYMDWGVFHVEPKFIDHWRRYQRALHQRNAALRNQTPVAVIQALHGPLQEHGKAMDACRRTYLETLMPFVLSYTNIMMLEHIELELHYQQGWPSDTELSELLDSHLDQDLRQGSTGYGPHRAELKILFNQAPAASVASRGQQKLCAAALVMAQVHHYQKVSNDCSLFLVDDLPSELDAEHRRRLLETLLGLNSQLLITATDVEQFGELIRQPHKVFHVEQGRVRELS